MALTDFSKTLKEAKMAYGNSTTKARSKSSFSPCAGCPNKAKCRAAGRCMKRSGGGSSSMGGSDRRRNRGARSM